MSVWLWVVVVVAALVAWFGVTVVVEIIRHRRREKVARAKVAATRMRVAADQVDRQHRAYLAGSDYGVYGNFAPIDPETGVAKDLGEQGQSRRTSDAFRANFKGLDSD